MQLLEIHQRYEINPVAEFIKLSSCVRYLCLVELFPLTYSYRLYESDILKRRNDIALGGWTVLPLEAVFNITVEKIKMPVSEMLDWRGFNCLNRDENLTVATKWGNR